MADITTSTIQINDGASTVNGNLTVTGDLTVGGTNFIVNTTTVEVEDNILQLNTTQGSPDTATATTSGISIYRGDGITQASLIFDDADDTWDLTNSLVIGGTVSATGGNSTEWNTGYNYSQIGHLPLSGGAVNGNVSVTGTNGAVAFVVNSTHTPSVNANRYGAQINFDISDSGAALTADRVYAALDINATSSVSGGDLSNEARIYGANVNVIATSDEDLVLGVFGVGGRQPGVGTTANTSVMGVQGVAYTNAGLDNAETITELIGIYGYSYASNSDGTNSNVGSAYGVLGKYLNTTGGLGAIVNAAYGGYFEVENDIGTITNAYGVRSVIDRDGGTTQNGYLFYGDFQGTIAGNKYGLWIAGESDNYISGDVGIGNSSPSAKLDVSGDTITRGTIYATNPMGVAGDFSASQISLNTTDSIDTTGWQGISFDTSTTANYGWSIGVNRSASGRGSFRFYEHNNSAIGAERFTIKQDGNVGIGESDPARALHIKHSTTAAIQLENTSEADAFVDFMNPSKTFRVGYDDSADAFKVAVTNFNDNSLVVSSSGDIGIGINAPTTKLDVDGVITATGGNSTSWNTAYSWGDHSTQEYFKKRDDIPTAADLNTYITDGYYHQNSNANAAAGSNYPEAQAGMLTVMSDGVMVYQTYQVYNNTTNTYRRGYYNGTWNSWKKIFYAEGGILNGDITINKTGGGALRLQNADTSNTQFQSLGRVEWYNQDASGFGPQTAAIIEAVAAGTAGQHADLLFKTIVTAEGADATTAMRIGSDGFVGIGTELPNAKLEINGGTDANTAKVLISGNDAIIRMGNNQAGGPHGLQFDHESTLPATDGMSMYYRTGTEQITFEDSTGVSGNKVMVIGRNGEVGIGTTDPTTKLDVRTDSTTYGMAIIQDVNTGYAPASILLEARQSTSRGSGLYHYNTQADISWYSGTLYSNTDKWGIAVKTGETTWNSDVAQTTYTKFVVDSVGNVGIGTPSPEGLLHVSAGTSGDAILIIEADTDNNAEGDIPQIWLRGDGGINGGAILYDDNELHLISNVASGNGIVFSVGSTNNYGTTAPTTGAVERMRIDASGNVGIGTNSPTAITSSAYSLSLGGTNATTSGALFHQINGVYKAYAFASTGSGYTFNTIGLPYTWMVDGSAKMSMSAAGGVGIGTTTVGTEANLHLGAKGTSEGGQLVLQKATSYTYDAHIDVWQDSLRILTGTGGIASSAVVARFDLSNNSFTSYGDILPSADNTGVIGNASYTWADGQFTNLSVNSTLTVVSTLNVRSAIDLADSDILRFGSSDDFKMYYDGTANEMEFEMEAACNQIRIHDNGTTRFTLDRAAGTFTATGDVIAYSDARVKENVETIDNALDKVMSMRGVSYNRTDTDDKSKKVGVIAQEIQQVLPEVVQEQADGMLGVSYGNIVGVLIEAMKEQQKQIDELKAIINGGTK